MDTPLENKKNLIYIFNVYTHRLYKLHHLKYSCDLLLGHFQQSYKSLLGEMLIKYFSLKRESPTLYWLDGTKTDKSSSFHHSYSQPITDLSSYSSSSKQLQSSGVLCSQWDAQKRKRRLKIVFKKRHFFIHPIFLNFGEKKIKTFGKILRQIP